VKEVPIGRYETEEHYFERIRKKQDKMLKEAHSEGRKLPFEVHGMPFGHRDTEEKYFERLKNEGGWGGKLKKSKSNKKSNPKKIRTKDVRIKKKVVKRKAVIKSRTKR
jgi:hypothetical protein